MAKIKQVKMRLGIDTEHPYRETVVSIYYDATDRGSSTYRRPVPKDSERFYIKLPSIVATALGKSEVRGANQSDVMKVFKEALEVFKCLRTEVNRVIIFDFDVEPKPNDERSSFDYGYKVRISAAVFDETVMTAGDGQKRYSYERIESDMNIGGEYGRRVGSDGRRESKQIPWSEKNEAFFCWVKVSMKLLIESLFEVGEPDRLIETIMADRLLPLGSHDEGH